MRRNKSEANNNHNQIPEGFKQTDIGLIPEDWDEIDFESTLSENDFSRDNLIPSSEFNSEGKYPIIDQGQDFIAGYTDVKEKVYKIKEPVVLFGDHTRIFKYIDFPFVGGADGIKIFTPQNKLYDSKFYYYALTHLKIPSRGYNRHYRLLKEQKIVKPPLSEQKKIAHVLSKIQQAIEKQVQIIKTTQELKKALMQKLFTEGLNGEPQKQTEIGPIPESWEVVTLRDILAEDLKNGAFIKNPKYGSGYKFVNVVDIYESAILNIEKLPRIDVKFDDIQGYLLKENDIVFVRSSLKREGIGESCLIRKLNEHLFFDCHLIRISPNISKIDPDYLVQYFRSNKGKEELIRRSKTTTMTTINQTNLAASLLPHPSIEQQKYLSGILNKLDEQIVFYSNIKNNYTELFNSSLNQLMTGQIRVKDIEFDIES